MTRELKIKYPYRWVNPQSEYPENRDIFLIIKVRSMEQWTKILSSGLEGAYLLYPDDHHDVSVPLMEFEMGCQSIVECLLENVGFMDGLKEYLINNPQFMSSIGNNLTQDTLIEGNVNQSDNKLTSGLEQRTTSLDVVYGGSKELIEYCLDIVKTVCFFISGIGNITDAVSQIYSKDKRKRYEFEANDRDGNPVQIGDDGELVNSGGEWEFIPNILGILVQAVSENTMIALLTELAGLGANLVLADITDTREEALTCIMFNTITCDGENQKPPPYVFDNETFYRACAGMLGNLDAGLAGQAIGFLGTVAGSINGFISAIPLDEVHRNFRIGMRNPSSEWEEACDTCQEPTNWEYTFDFTTSSHEAFWEAVPVEISGFGNSETSRWESGSGYGGGRILSPSFNQSEVAIIKGTFDTSTITSIEVVMFFVSGMSGFFSNQLVLRTTKTNSIYSKSILNSGGLKTEAKALAVVSPELFIQVRGYSRAGNNDPMGETWIRSVKFTGTGFNPFL